MKYSLLFFLILCCFSAQAQDNALMEFKGKLIQKPWSKSSQSYCAQGSDYFVIQLANKEEYVLQEDEHIHLKSFINKKVLLTGKLIEKKISNDDNLQHPVTLNPDGTQSDQDFKCTVLKIATIKVL